MNIINFKYNKRFQKHGYHIVKEIVILILYFRNAPVKWAQRKDRIFLTITLRDIKDESVNVEAQKFTFSGTSDGKKFLFEEDLFAEVLPEETT